MERRAPPTHELSELSHRPRNSAQRCGTARIGSSWPALALAWTLLAAPVAAQCLDPAAPFGGFELVTESHRLITFSDGAQTYADIRYPQASPGTCGWPVMVLVHGLRRSKSSARVTSTATRLSRLGYLTLCYDLRGHGAFTELNPPAFGAQLSGEAERLDFVEVIDFLRTSYGTGPSPRADLGRLGVFGLSLGGVQSWMAAAWSGKPIPQPNQRGLVGDFPVVHAALAYLAPSWQPKLLAPDDKALRTLAISVLYGGGPVHYDPIKEAHWKSLIESEDFAGLNAEFDTDPFRADLEQLADSTVPVLAVGSWNDVFFDGGLLLESHAGAAQHDRLAPPSRHGAAGPW